MHKPIEIIVRTIDEHDFLVLDGFLIDKTEGVVKPQHILDSLENLGYITINIEDE